MVTIDFRKCKKGFEKVLKSKLIVDQYYKLVFHYIGGLKYCSIYEEMRPICSITEQEVDEYFYTLVEERELKLIELGI